MKLVVNGAHGLSDIPGLQTASKHVEIAFAPDEQELRNTLPESDILLGWNFRGRDLRNQWEYADNLKWIHWCGAGVDSVLFPELASSDVTLTNARGIFDRAMAEYVLGYMLAKVKGFQTTLTSQANKNWNFRLTGKLYGTKAVVFGVGSIGREIAALLSAVGVEVVGVGRNPRTGDPIFGNIFDLAGAEDAVRKADWVIGVMPLTKQTRGLFDRTFFNGMKPTAQFINVGRGQSVVEDDLKEALEDNQIAGAMLDVFTAEPVPESSPLWDTPNLVLSPHMSGDYLTAESDMVDQFLANLERFVANEPLINVVDKELGFVRSAGASVQG